MATDYEMSHYDLYDKIENELGKMLELSKRHPAKSNIRHKLVEVRDAWEAYSKSQSHRRKKIHSMHREFDRIDEMSGRMALETERLRAIKDEAMLRVKQLEPEVFDNSFRYSRLSPEVSYHQSTDLGDELRHVEDQLYSHHYPPAPKQFYDSYQGLRDVSPLRGSQGLRDVSPRGYQRFREISPRGQRGYEQGFNGTSLTQMMKRSGYPEGIPRPGSHTPSSASPGQVRQDNPYHQHEPQQHQQYRDQWPQWEQPLQSDIDHRYPPTNNLEQRYTSQSNLRHWRDQDQLQAQQTYDRNEDQKYCNEKRRYKKKNETKKEPINKKHSVADSCTDNEDPITDDDTSQDADDISDLEQNKHKNNLKTRKIQHTKKDRAQQKEKGVNHLEKRLEKVNTNDHKNEELSVEERDSLNIDNYIIGSDVDAEKLYSPRSDTSSGTQRKENIESPKTNIPKETTVKHPLNNIQSTNSTMVQKSTKPLNIQDDTTSESSNQIQAKAIVHNNATVINRQTNQQSSTVMNKSPTIPKESSVLNTSQGQNVKVVKNENNKNSGMSSSGLNQSQAYKNLVAGNKPGAEQSVPVDDDTTSDEMELAIAPRHNNRKPMKFGLEDEEQNFDDSPDNKQFNNQNKSDYRTTGGMGGLGGMGHPMPVYAGGAYNSGQVGANGGQTGSSSTVKTGLLRGRLSHPAANTAAILALNSGSDAGSRFAGDGNVSAPEKDDDDFWD